jgi:hypothetical protein
MPLIGSETALANELKAALDAGTTIAVLAAALRDDFLASEDSAAQDNAALAALCTVITSHVVDRVLPKLCEVVASVVVSHIAANAVVSPTGSVWKDEVRVASSANLNTSSPGATIDGITLSNNDRVLLKAQTVASQNGIYVWTGAATALTRASDANAFGELEGAVVTVEEGTDAGSTWRQTQVGGTINSSDVVWALTWIIL